MPRRFGFGLGFNLSRLTGAIREPSGFVAKFTSYLVDNFTLVTNNQVSQWDDESANVNDLTQGTSANQPVLVENDLVTQSTLSNQPTLVDTGGGVLAMQFNSHRLSFDAPVSNITSFEVDYSGMNPSEGNWFSRNTLGTCIFYANVSTYTVRSDQGTYHSFSFTPVASAKIRWDMDGSDVKFYVNDNLEDTVVTTDTFSINAIGDTGASGFKGDLKSLVVTNAQEIQTFLSQAQYIPSGIGNPAPKWYATQHNKFENRVSFDGTDDNMGGLPAQAGDFSYVWRVEHSALSTTDYVFSSSGTPSALVWLSDNYLYLRDTTGAGDIGLTNHTLEAGEHTYALVREGNDIRFYVDSILKQTVNVTGRTYTWDRVGDTADSLLALSEYFYVYNKALTQDEIDWFSYLRNDQNEILQPPLLPS